ncbi:hypothetical protein [Natronoarchaeum philippinense]|uniref:hypothetical protein n=1 Tax=Natronoarchaeum philippinense TaxID=558529 RepID=UPI00117C46AF|nr:hypothetical protein [Natronoarchaeum philippinense]
MVSSVIHRRSVRSGLTTSLPVTSTWVTAADDDADAAPASEDDGATPTDALGSAVVARIHQAFTF